MRHRIALVALAAVLAGPTLCQEDDLSPAARQRVEDLCRRVETLRGLEFQERVAVGVIDKAGLAEFLAREIDEEMPPEDMEAARLSLVAFGLLPDGADLRQIYIDLMTEGIAGFYDPQTDQLRLVTEGDDLLAELGENEEVWIHELCHALDDQHFDLEAMTRAVEDNDDAVLAGNVLTEGVATHVMFAEQLPPGAAGSFDIGAEVLAGVLRFSEYAGNQGGDDADRDLARFKEYFMAGMIAPYREGLRFSRGLHAAGGWAAVDRAYRSPPVSTEQVLHPEKYAAGEAPVAVEVPDVAAELGEGHALVETNHLGELQIRLAFRHHLEVDALGEGLFSGLHRLFGRSDGVVREAYDRLVTRRSPVELAAGWGGDTYRVYSSPSGAPALVWRTAWDSRRDASEFARGIEDAYGASAVVVEAGDVVDVLLGVPPTRLEAVLESLAASR